MSLNIVLDYVAQALLPVLGLNHEGGRHRQECLCHKFFSSHERFITAAEGGSSYA